MDHVKKNKNTSIAEQDVIQNYLFIKEHGRWYIDLPDYLEHGWTKKDLEMVEGTNKLLNILAHGKDQVHLSLSTEPFDCAYQLELKEHCDAPRGGAIYFLQTCHGKTVRRLIWICDIALLIFGDMPETIYVEQVA